MSKEEFGAEKPEEVDFLSPANRVFRDRFLEKMKRDEVAPGVSDEDKLMIANKIFLDMQEAGADATKDAPNTYRQIKEKIENYGGAVPVEPREKIQDVSEEISKTSEIGKTMDPDTRPRDKRFEKL